MCCNQRQSCNTWDWILLEEYFLRTQVDTTWCGVGQRAGCGDRSWSMDWKPSPVPDYWPHGSRLLVSPDRWLDVLTCRLLCSDEFKPNSQTFFVYSLDTKWDWREPRDMILFQNIQKQGNCSSSEPPMIPHTSMTFCQSYQILRHVT